MKKKFIIDLAKILSENSNNSEKFDKIFIDSAPEPIKEFLKRKISMPFDTNLEHIREYLEKCVELSPIQKKIQQQNKRMPEGRMQIRPELAHFLAFQLRLIKPKTILEVGSYTGFSALTFAEATDTSCKITTIDRNFEWTKLAKQFWLEANIDDRITLLFGDAVNVLNDLIQTSSHSFDFIFIDADKKNYELYVNQALSLLSSGGLIVVDNVLWRGEAAKKDSTDPIAKMIQEFNEKMFERNDLMVSVVPLDDGIMLIQQK